MFKFDEAGIYGKEAMDQALKSYSYTTKGFQAIVAEASDYAKKSIESNVAHMQTLMGVKSIESAVELQTTYAKSAMEAYIAEMTKLAEMYADLAKDAYKPAETAVTTATETVKTKAEKVAAAAA